MYKQLPCLFHYFINNIFYSTVFELFALLDKPPNLKKKKNTYHSTSSDGKPRRNLLSDHLDFSTKYLFKQLRYSSCYIANPTENE